MKMVYKIIFFLCISSTNLFAIYDYSIDISPIIRNKKMFSFGYALSYSEFNGYFSGGTLWYGDVNNISTTFISSELSMAPYFEYRPKPFLEIGLSLPFSYHKNEVFNILLNEETITSGWVFNSVHTYVKVAIIDWFLSLSFRLDADIAFANRFAKFDNFKDNFDMSAKIMLAIVPKKIPVNFLFNYEQHFGKEFLMHGVLQGGVEAITSDFLIVTLGANYMFPYTKEDRTSSLEVFAKLSVFFDDFLSGNASYAKNVYGENVGNDATFLINLSYHF